MPCEKEAIHESQAWPNSGRGCQLWLQVGARAQLLSINCHTLGPDAFWHLILRSLIVAVLAYTT